MPFNIEDYGYFPQQDGDGVIFISEQQGVVYKLDGQKDDEGETSVTVHELILEDERDEDDSIYSEQKIGYIDLSAYNNHGERNLDEIGVDFIAFRNRKIGTVLIALAVQELDLGRICCSIDPSRERWLWPDGERLIASCVRQHIVTPDMCLFPGEYYHSNLVQAALAELRAEIQPTAQNPQAQIHPVTYMRDSNYSRHQLQLEAPPSQAFPNPS